MTEAQINILITLAALERCHAPMDIGIRDLEVHGYYAAP